ncbi:dermonecrotic toxin domain-containing protein [Pseudomonas sp. xss_2]|uniref:dermonecrotic toxin domain-containing protein n=1 Tax=Pseudomonas sp. xss_2 TaxID=3367215 RepID=UPI00370A110E
MTPLLLLQALDAKLPALVPPLPGVEHHLNQCLASLFPALSITARTLHFGRWRLLDLVGLHLFDGGTFTLPVATQARHDAYPQLRLPGDFSTRIGSFCTTIRQTLHADLASYWLERDSKGLSREVRVASLRREQLFTEVRLRLSDQTLSPEHAQVLTTCLELALPWQRRHLPATRRPQLYRPLLCGTAPHWRSHLPGVLILTEQGPEGRLLDDQEPVGRVILCSIAHGIEAFDSLAELHVELCERLEDQQQNAPLCKLLVEPEQQRRTYRAERLRYDWYSEDLAQSQALAIRNAHAQRLTLAWQNAFGRGLQRDIERLDAELATSLDLRHELSSQGPLATRYGLLLEQHLPNWLRTTSQQGVAHIMQAMQEQVAAIQAAAAPGILTLEQFNQRHSLMAWVRARLREFLRRDPGIDTDPQDVRISVTLARRVGPLPNPLDSSGYIPVVSRPQAGSTVELVNHTYRLDELALLNIAWFDVDYWLTARVHLDTDQVLPALTPLRVKQIIRHLNAGSGYQAYLRTQLLDSPQGRWRQQAHGQLNRARMNAEAVKARYAGHFQRDTFEQGYGWASTVVHAPDSHTRPHYNEQQVIVRQMLIQEQTLQGVLLLVSPENSNRIVVYCPDAPDRRPWREYTNARAMIRAVRNDAGLRRYVLQRLPLGNGKALENLLLKGRLGSHIKLQTITGDLYQASYRAEVNYMMAETDRVTRSNQELLGEYSVNLLRLLLDIVTLVLPQAGSIALAFGRMSISIWDGFEAFEADDHSGALHHAVAALGHATSGLNDMTGSGLMRRAMRGLPKPPPVPIPTHYEATPEVASLRYRIDAPHGEAVYEKRSTSPGLSQYFVKDNLGRYFNVTFDGTRWRAIDPDLPNAYLRLPIKRCLDGSWVVDSPLLWHDGLPDLQQLLDDCRLTSALHGVADADDENLFEENSQLYVQLGANQFSVRRHLLKSHYHLVMPESLRGSVAAWAVLRWQDDQWRIRVRQTGRSSDWLALPAAYSASLGSS